MFKIRKQLHFFKTFIFCPLLTSCLVYMYSLVQVVNESRGAQWVLEEGPVHCRQRCGENRSQQPLLQRREQPQRGDHEVRRSYRFLLPPSPPQPPHPSLLMFLFGLFLCYFLSLILIIALLRPNAQTCTYSFHIPNSWGPGDLNEISCFIDLDWACRGLWCIHRANSFPNEQQEDLNTLLILGAVNEAVCICQGFLFLLSLRDDQQSILLAVVVLLNRKIHLFRSVKTKTKKWKKSF